MTTKKISIIAIVAGVLYFAKMADNRAIAPTTDTAGIPDNMAISDELGG